MAQTRTTTMGFPTPYVDNTATYSFDHDLLNVPEAQAPALFMYFESIDDTLGLNGKHDSPKPLDTIELAKQLDPRTPKQRRTPNVRMEDLDKGNGRIVGRAASPNGVPGEGPRLYSNLAARKLALGRDRLKVLEAQRLAGIVANGMCCPLPEATHCSETNEPHPRYDGPAVAWHYQPPQYPDTDTYPQALLRRALPINIRPSLTRPETVDPWDLSLAQAPMFYRKMFMDTNMPPCGDGGASWALGDALLLPVSATPYVRARSPSLPKRIAVVEAKKTSAKRNSLAKKVRALHRRGSQVY